MYILAQCIGFVATAILLTYTLMTVSRRTIMLCNIAMDVLWTVHYLILGAYTGAFCSLFTGLMVLACAFKGKNKFFTGPWVPILFNIGFIIIEIFTWAGYPTLIQMAGNILLVCHVERPGDRHQAALHSGGGAVVYLQLHLLLLDWSDLPGPGGDLQRHLRHPVFSQQKESQNRIIKKPPTGNSRWALFYAMVTLRRLVTFRRMLS